MSDQTSRSAPESRVEELQRRLAEAENEIAIREWVEPHAALIAADGRVKELEQALRDLLDNLGGHSHWREGGAGGRCETCVNQSKAASRARAALAASPVPEEQP